MATHHRLRSTNVMAHHGCAHDHSEQSKSGAELGAEYNLHLKIDKDRLECLNEAVDNSGRTVFKSWENRLAKDEVGLVCLPAIEKCYFKFCNIITIKECQLCCF